MPLGPSLHADMKRSDILVKASRHRLAGPICGIERLILRAVHREIATYLEIILNYSTFVYTSSCQSGTLRINCELRIYDERDKVTLTCRYWHNRQPYISATRYARSCAALFPRRRRASMLNETIDTVSLWIRRCLSLVKTNEF